MKEPKITFSFEEAIVTSIQVKDAVSREQLFRAKLIDIKDRRTDAEPR